MASSESEQTAAISRSAIAAFAAFLCSLVVHVSARIALSGLLCF
jgi:hypothetical protein